MSELRVELPKEGPFLATALFCQKFIRAQDGSASIIHIVDRVDLPNVEKEALPPNAILYVQPQKVTAVIIFRRGSFRGKKRLYIQGKNVDGTLGPLMAHEADFSVEGESLAFDVAVNVANLAAGRYYFDISLDEVFYSSIGLTIRRVDTELL